MSTQKKFQYNFNFHEFVSTYNIVDLTYNIVDLKIWQVSWPRAFWPISQEPHFSKYGICAGT